MTDRSSPGMREALARFALELDGINDRFADHEHQRSDALSAGVSMRPATEISIDDWDALLSAVNARLRQAVGEAIMGQFNGTAAPFRTMVLECVDALEHLQAALEVRRTRQRQVEASEQARPGDASAAAPDPAFKPLADLADGSAAPSTEPAAPAATHPRTAPA